MDIAARGIATPERWVALGKDLLALLRDLVLVLLFVILLLFPGVVKDKLKRAGLREGSVMGFKWQAEEFGDASRVLQQSLDDAKRQLAVQAQVIAANQALLAKLQAAGPEAGAAISPQASAESTATSRQVQVNAAVLTRSRAVTAAVGATLAKTAPVVAQARELAGDTQWGVVLSGDPALAAARYEVDLARRRGLDDVRLYRRQGWYRGVALAPDRDAAEAALAVAKGRQASAYIVDLGAWCPKPATTGTGTGEVIECR